MTPDAKTARLLTSAIFEPVAEVLVKRARAEVLREEIDALKVKILTAGDFRHMDDDSRRILDPSEGWLINDEQAPAYFAALERETAAAGHDVPAGYCPALMAEMALVEAERALLEVAAPFLGTTEDRLSHNMDRRRKVIRLLCTMAAKA